MMKILVVSNMYPSNKYPHYGVFVENTVKILIKNQHIVSVSAMKKCDRKLQKMLSYAIFILSTVLKIVFGNFDIIYVHYASHSSIPVLIARKFKKNIRIVTNVHGNDIVPETRNDYKFLKFSRSIINYSKVIISPSDYFRDVLKEKYNVDVYKIVVYPSGGIDNHVFRHMDREEAVRKLGLDNTIRYIGYISRIEKNKGYDIFLKAANLLSSEYSNLKFIIVGDGDENEKLESLINSYNLKDKIIEFKFLPQKKVAEVMNALDVFVFPTYRESESLGLIGLEAMSCGTLTVMPNKYGPSSYANQNNSFIFESGDYKSLYFNIAKALSCECKVIDHLLENAYKTAKKYSASETQKVLIEGMSKAYER